VNADGSVGDNSGGGTPVLPTVSLAPTNGETTEGDTGNTVVTFTATLSEVSNSPVYVDFTTLSGIALSVEAAFELYGSTAEADFIGASGTLVFPPDTTQQTFSIEILGDTRLEDNESFLIGLSNVQGALLDAEIAFPGSSTSGTVIHSISNDDFISSNVFVVDDDIYPASAVTYIESVWGSSVFSGSGVIIGENDVLTAAHVIYNDELGGIADEIRVYPSYDPYAFDNTAYNAVWVEYYPNFDPDNDGRLFPGDGEFFTQEGSEIDIALLSLNIDIGNIFGRFGVDVDFSGSEGSVGVMGHPGLYDNQNVYDEGFINRSLIDDVYFVDTDTLELNPGNSGGPVYFDYGDGPYAVGIVSTRGYATEIGAHWWWLEESIVENDVFLGPNYQVSNNNLVEIDSSLALVGSADLGFGSDYPLI
jgi:V8-like Glu-specific endopeptidase